MGAKQSSRTSVCRKTIVKNLLATTNFSKIELKAIRRSFHKDYPNGSLTRQQFHHVFSAFFPLEVQLDGSTQVFENHLFRSFDSNNDGNLDFCEFVQALSVLQRGSPQEKLEWMFRLYDIDGDGELTKDDIVEIANSSRRMRTSVHYHLSSENESCQSFSISEEDDAEKLSSLRRASQIAEAQAYDLFSTLDEEGSGKVSKEEFLSKARESPDVHDKIFRVFGARSDCVVV